MRDQALSSLERTFGPLLNQLKADQVKDMNMDRSEINDNKIRALGPILANSKTLKKISFRKNKITDKGVEYLCNYLIDSSIEVIDLSSNKISLKSLTYIKEFKTKNKNVKHILLIDNDIPAVKRKRGKEFQKMGLLLDL